MRTSHGKWSAPNVATIVEPGCDAPLVGERGGGAPSFLTEVDVDRFIDLLCMRLGDRVPALVAQFAIANFAVELYPHSGTHLVGVGHHHGVQDASSGMQKLRPSTRTSENLDFANASSGQLPCRAFAAVHERNPLSRYRVTLRRDSVEIVTAENPFQAAIVAADLFGDGVEVADVRPAVGRAPSTTRQTSANKSVKKVAKKRRPMSPEARAKLAQNLVKARAARARNVKAAKKATKKRATKKVGRPVKKGSIKRV